MLARQASWPRRPTRACRTHPLFNRLRVLGAILRPYREDDAPDPINTYGKTKLAGESAIAASGAPYLILRTSWVFGSGGKNFFSTIID